MIVLHLWMFQFHVIWEGEISTWFPFKQYCSRSSMKNIVAWCLHVLNCCFIWLWFLQTRAFHAKIAPQTCNNNNLAYYFFPFLFSIIVFGKRLLECVAEVKSQMIIKVIEFAQLFLLCSLFSSIVWFFGKFCKSHIFH